ncbi:hypothetical protein Slala04_66940 [Streptomyces lavendulae subsp. lavendulae]|uniref:toll/interleukin-1 receptor domain-containing protein n=1 Tax=Streptomyces sp. XY593 TaxID=1519483 RepID=UPI000AE0B641|nr:toll/interleukin-1 receptor domain-containing protein [Streptomyces sp. XY593]GLV95241.1 hypothetical protein Slala04_66940 [Streptomyces lavendulae subsp. lavendulae]
MRYFVSYARRDNSAARLLGIKEMISGATSIYVDDLETHPPGVDRVRTVVDALMGADVFLAVQSTHYLKTEWTQWELETAIRGKVEVQALLPDGTFIRWGAPEWPWPAERAGEGVVAVR